MTRDGREYVVLVSAEDLESLEATIELLQDEDVVARVRESLSDVAAGRLTSAEEMADILAHRKGAPSVVTAAGDRHTTRRTSEA